MVKLEEKTMLGFHNQIEEVVANLNKSFDRHLDLGCGSGALLNRLKRYSKHQFGSDINRKDYAMLDLVTFQQADLNKEYPFDEKMDLITCVEVIEHVENQFKLIRDVSNHLNEGGYCLITTPNNYTIFNKLYFVLCNNFIHFNNRNMLNTGHINPVMENIFLYYAEKSGLILEGKQYSNCHIPIINVQVKLRNRIFGNATIYIFRKRVG